MRCIIAVLLLAGIMLAGCQGLAGEPVVVSTLPPRPTIAPVVEPQGSPDLVLGARIYAENCTRCHGLTGKGDGEFVLSGQVTGVADLTNPQTVAGKTPADYFNIITNGNLEKLMPPWGEELTEAERWAVTYYVYSLSSSSPAEVASAGTPAPATVAPLSTEEAVVTTEEAVVATEDAAAPSAVGTVRGQLINGTSGAAAPANQEVVLHIVDEQFNDTPLIGSSDASGAYQFANVPIRADRSYILTVDYNGVRFLSDIFPGDPAVTDIALPVTVYELGAEAAAIQITSVVTQVSATQTQAQLTQLVNFTNTSDRVFLFRSETEETSVGVPVPVGATYRDLMGAGYIVSADGRKVFDTLPVLPGEDHRMHLVFTLPYASPLSIQQPLDYQLTGTYEVLVGTDGLSVASDQLTTQGTRQIGSGPMTSYSAQLDLPASASVTYQVSGVPVAPEPAAVVAELPAAQPAPTAYLLIGVGLGSIGFAAILYFRDRMVARRAPAVPTPAAPAPTQDMNDLVRQIAELDLQHQEGKLSRKAYERQRAELKARLTVLAKGDKQ
ncbi:MAG: c-type cytochrome [Anaerolineae bacterium]|nr:c-type cytochrome [Anaerolineae bacterium]